MASESAPRSGSGAENGSIERGQLVLFPAHRSFGPLSWRAVKIASLTVLVLILTGAVLELFLGRSLREIPRAAPKASKVPS